MVCVGRATQAVPDGLSVSAGLGQLVALLGTGFQPKQPSNQGDSGVRAVLGIGMGFVVHPLQHTRVSQGLRALPWCWEQEK